MADPEIQKQVKFILSELRDISKDKRRTAVMKLGMIGGDEAVRALIRTVENNQEDLIVRGRAALMLGKLKDNRAVPTLIRALDAPGFQTPMNAAEALGRIGDTRAIDALVGFADASRDKTRVVALEALKQLGYEFSDEENAEPEPEL
jgi:HEAT repeat protein